MWIVKQKIENKLFLKNIKILLQKVVTIPFSFKSIV